MLLYLQDRAFSPREAAPLPICSFSAWVRKASANSALHVHSLFSQAIAVSKTEWPNKGHEKEAKLSTCQWFSWATSSAAGMHLVAHAGNQAATATSTVQSKRATRTWETRDPWKAPFLIVARLSWSVTSEILQKECCLHWRGSVIKRNSSLAAPRWLLALSNGGKLTYPTNRGTWRISLLNCLQPLS